MLCINADVTKGQVGVRHDVGVLFNIQGLFEFLDSGKQNGLLLGRRLPKFLLQRRMFLNMWQTLKPLQLRMFFWREPFNFAREYVCLLAQQGHHMRIQGLGKTASAEIRMGPSEGSKGHAQRAVFELTCPDQCACECQNVAGLIVSHDHVTTVTRRFADHASDIVEL